MKKKNKTIRDIQKILKKYNNSLNSAELNLETSPCYVNLGNSVSLIESLYDTEVEVVTYIRDQAEGYFNVDYKDLSQELLDEILSNLEQYDIDAEKTMERCQDSNW